MASSKRMVAACGLICTECPAFIATQGNDDEKRRKVAEEWSAWGEKLVPQDINCDGCVQVGGRLFKFCTTCEVRGCALERKFENCAHCGDYPCQKLDKLLKSMDAPKAKENLDGIKRGLTGQGA